MKEKKLNDEKLREFARKWIHKLNFYTAGHVSEGIIKSLVKDYDKWKEEIE